MTTKAEAHGRLVSILLLILGVVPPGVLAGEFWTLERAIEHTLASNPDSQIAEQRIAAARAGIEQAHAAFWPQVQFQSSYMRTDHPASVFAMALNQRAFSTSLDFNDVPDADNLNLRGTVTVPIYTGGRNVAGRDAAEANSAAARALADAVRHTLAFEAARAFFTILKARALIRAAEAAVHSFERNLAIARNRLDAGSALKSEVLDMEVRLAQTREDLVRSRNGNALAVRALRTVLGIEEGDLSVADAAPEMTVPGSLDYAQRAELLAIGQQQDAAHAEVRRARAGYQPRVSALAGVDHNRGWEFDGDGTSYSAGVVVQWDVWDGLLTHGRVSEANARLAAVREEERNLRLGIAFEVEQARLQLDDATERLAVTAAAIAQAEESVGITRARFEQGRATSTQLIDAETALTAARVRRAEAEADRQIAIAALRKAIGLPQLDGR